MRLRANASETPTRWEHPSSILRQTLHQHPRLRATRLYQMVHDRGYSGGVVQLRRTVARLRPQSREPFLQLQTFPGEQAQVEGAHFGHVMLPRIRSPAYFQPVVDELLENPAPGGYLQYLRLKQRSVLDNPGPAIVQKSTFSDDR